MEDEKHQQVMNYIRDLGVELLRSLERGTQATLSLKDTGLYKQSVHTNELLEKLLKLETPDYSKDVKEQTKTLKELSKAQSDGTKAVISAIKEAKPTIPPFPKEITATVDFKPLSTPLRDLLSAVKDIPKKLGAFFDSFGTKTRPVYVVQVDEEGKVVTPQQAQRIVQQGGVVRTVTLANKAGVEINPATNEKLDEVISEITDNAPAQILKATFDLTGSGNVLTPTSGKRLKIHAIKFTLTADVTSVAFNFGVGANFEKFSNCKGGGLYGNNLHPNFLLGATNEALKLTLVGTATVSVNVDYQEIN